MEAVIISGPPCVGKTTLAKYLAKKFKLHLYSGGYALKKVARKLGYTKATSSDWWDTKEGMEFLRKREEDFSIDKEVDKLLIKRAKKGNVVMTSWTLPWLMKGNCIKIWLKASPKARAKRMSERDGISFSKALKIVRERDRKNKELYQKLYGIKFGEDLTPFHLVIDTENLDSRSVAKVVESFLTHYWRSKK